MLIWVLNHIKSKVVSQLFQSHAQGLLQSAAKPICIDHWSYVLSSFLYYKIEVSKLNTTQYLTITSI
jgi:hypothetical protein